jgi:hypothetical protein
MFQFHEASTCGMTIAPLQDTASAPKNVGGNLRKPFSDRPASHPVS